MPSNHFLRATALGLATAALVAGCGGDDSADVPSAPTASVPTVTTPGQVPTPEATTKGGGGKTGGDVGRPNGKGTPEPQFTAAPDVPDTKAAISVSAAGIKVTPDPLPKNRRVRVTLRGAGLGKKAYVQIFEGDRQIASAQLLAKPVKFETETISDTVTIEVTGTDKVAKRKKVVQVR